MQQAHQSGSAGVYLATVGVYLATVSVCLATVGVYLEDLRWTSLSRLPIAPPPGLRPCSSKVPAGQVSCWWHVATPHPTAPELPHRDTRGSARGVAGAGWGRNRGGAVHCTVGRWIKGHANTQTHTCLTSVAMSTMGRRMWCS